MPVKKETSKEVPKEAPKTPETGEVKETKKTYTGKRKTVLFIDAHNEIARDVQNLFDRNEEWNEEKYELLFAENAKEAMDQLGKKKVDVIVTEIILPIINGYHLLNILKKKSVPVIIYTNLKNEEDLNKMATYKVDNIVLKELTKIEDLMVIIEKGEKLKIPEVINKIKTDLEGKAGRGETHSKFKMLQCSKCNIILLPESHFCNNCGEKVLKETEPNPLKADGAGGELAKNEEKEEKVEQKKKEEEKTKDKKK